MRVAKLTHTLQIAKLLCLGQFVRRNRPVRTLCNLDEGFRAIKMKVGRDNLSEDIERVRAMREYLGPDVPLMVDANMRWNVETAIRAARRLRQFDVFWLEEPTIPDDVPGHARIAVEGGLPIATGENLRTVFEFRTMIEQGAISYPEPDVSNIGGITAWMRVAGLAYAHNLPVPHLHSRSQNART